VHAKSSSAGSGQQLLTATFVILNVTEGGVKDLLYPSFNIGAKRRSAKIDSDPTTL
jgi:hypothetical protein